MPGGNEVVVIVRISSIAIPNARIDDYLEYLQRDLIPRYETAEGIESVWVLQRRLLAYDEVTTISVWQAEEALTRFFEGRPLNDPNCEYSGIEFESHTYKLVRSSGGWQRF